MKNKTTAGLLAIFLGAYGVQHFYLGDKDKGLKYLLISLFTFGVGLTVIGIISLIEGIKFLSMSDDEFNGLYNKDIPQDIPATKTQAPVAQKTNSATNYEKIKQYKELYDMGAITEEEFNDIKRDLLK